MNIPLLLLILIFGHVLGDFYFQSNAMAEKKRTSFKWLAVHGIAYAACIALALFILVWFGGVAYSRNLLWIFALISVSHLAVDLLKKFAVKLLNHKWVFTVDQAVHFLFLILAWWLWGRGHTIGYFIYDFAHYILIAFGLLVIIRPIGMLIESGIIWSFNNEQMSTAQVDASRMIGYLERIVVYFLLLNGEYSAIALVIAAKSIARFPDIKDENGYLQANYYIIGTFLSLTSVFGVTVLLGLIA